MKAYPRFVWLDYWHYPAHWNKYAIREIEQGKIYDKVKRHYAGAWVKVYVNNQLIDASASIV